MAHIMYSLGELDLDADEDNEELDNLKVSVLNEDVKIINSIADLNWAWLYKKNEDSYIQFDCLNCMILESKW